MTEPGGSADVETPSEPTAPDDDVGSVTVVGTAHVSADSVERVRESIAAERPDVVAVELDEGRYRQLQGETPDDIEATDLLGGNTVFQFLAYWMLSYVQNRLGDRFDIEPGADMRAGIEAAEEHGLGLALVDRDIQTTMQRFWARLTFREKLNLVGGLALGVTDPRTIGVSMGIALGVMLGLAFGLAIAPVLGLAEALTLGLAGTTAVGVLGGVVLGALVGLFVGIGIVPSVRVPGLGRIGLVERGVGGLLVGLAAGGALAATDIALPVVGAPDFVSVGGVIVRGVTGSLLGVLVGGLVGVGLGALFATNADPDEFEEFDIEELTDTDVVTAMMEEFRRFSPGGAEALIDERDAYIAYKLLALRDQGYDVVAIVGAGHREGIERYLEAPETLPSMDSITGTESGGRRAIVAKAVGYLITVGFVGFFVLLALGGAQDTFLLRLFGAWFLFNGAFAFTAARIAGARLSSAGIGGVVAWLTSINPLLAPGWFAGYVELRHRPVNVADIATLNDLLDDHERPIGEILEDMFDVPLFRLIAVVAMTNVGSIVASLLFPFVVLPFFFEGVAGVSEIGDLLIEGARNGATLLREVVT